MSLTREDGGRQMSVAVTLQRWNEPDSSGRPQRHPIDDAPAAPYRQAMCGGGPAPVRGHPGLTHLGPRVPAASSPPGRGTHAVRGVQGAAVGQGGRLVVVFGVRVVVSGAVLVGIPAGSYFAARTAWEGPPNSPWILLLASSRARASACWPLGSWSF